MSELFVKHCVPCEGGVKPFDKATVTKYLAKLEGWDQQKEYAEIARHFHFTNYYETMAFVNAIAYMAHKENHHPDLEVGYNYCRVRYSTHSVGGLSENDFICAAKVNRIYSQE